MRKLVEIGARACVFPRATTTMVSVVALAGSVAAACPPLKNGVVVFEDNSIGTSTGLAVNPDGAAGSYAPGDHGYTYLSNGVNLIENGVKVPCSSKPNTARCNRDWSVAEHGGFAAGTPEFCSFAIEVEPFTAGAQRIACELPQTGRFVIGNGKGKPVTGAPIPTVSGAMVSPYLSTTTLTHTVHGKTAYVDSIAVPGLVVPKKRPDLVGAIAWVRYGGREVFAIVNDTGPRFGEGSIALHQALRGGKIGPIQALGPIDISGRCGIAETSLRPPFESRPDAGKSDRCRNGYQPKTAADIRGYVGIEAGVTSIVMPAARPPMQGRTATVELTPELLERLAKTAGYTAERLAKMAACVSQ